MPTKSDGAPEAPMEYALLTAPVRLTLKREAGTGDQRAYVLTFAADQSADAPWAPADQPGVIDLPVRVNGPVADQFELSGQYELRLIKITQPAG